MVISQDTFNRLITIYLVLFFSGVYMVSYITGKPVDWQALTVFIVPTVNHIVHQITQTQLATKNIDSNTQTTVASINKEATTNGVK